MWPHDYFLARHKDVIAFAWSAPMRDLAKRIGISDVGLKKLLKSHGITPPPQGHWNKVHAGKPVGKPPSPPERRPGQIGRVRLDGRFRDHIPEAGRMPIDGPFTSGKVPESLDELRQNEVRVIGKVTVPRDLGRAHRGLTAILKKEELRREKFEKSGWRWDQPKHDHPIAQRQLRFANALLKTLSLRGHGDDLREAERGFEINVEIGDTQLIFELQLAANERTAARYSQVDSATIPASTPIRLARRAVKQRVNEAAWEDDKSGKIERRLAEIVAEMIVIGEARFRASLVEARETEEQFQRWKDERRRREIEQLEAKRVNDLRTSAELLREAELMRDLVARVELAMVREGKFDQARIDAWKRWALEQADQIDPILSGQVLTHLHVPELDDENTSPGAIDQRE